MRHIRSESCKTPKDQTGQTILILVLILAMGTAFTLFSVATPGPGGAEQLRRNAKTSAVLAQTRQALIAWSAARTPDAGSPTSRPGELPCPDRNNNGMDDDGTCSAGTIGRVPWKTLGVQEPIDGNGETLWYSVAGPYRYKNMNSNPITSDTQGNLVVYQNSSATQLTNKAIAVLFAAGPAVGTQSRNSATAACTTTGTTIARQDCAANYLEAAGGGNNAQTGGPYIKAAASDTFNDQVVAITNADLMPLVEQRVAREMVTLLRQYKNTVGEYPWADFSDGKSNTGVNRGRFPCDQNDAEPEDWGRTSAPITPALPDWLTNGCGNNGWASLVYYTAAQDELDGGCTTCTAGTLNVANSGNADLCSASAPFTCTLADVSSGPAEVILITPGAADGSPRNWPWEDGSSITGYFEDAQNLDKSDDNYIIPASFTRFDHDRIFIVR